MYRSKNPKVTALIAALRQKGMFSDDPNADCWASPADMLYFENCCNDNRIKQCIRIVDSGIAEQDIEAKLSQSGLLSCTPQRVGKAIAIGYMKYLCWVPDEGYKITCTADGYGVRTAPLAMVCRAIQLLRGCVSPCILMAASLLSAVLPFRKAALHWLQSEDVLNLFDSLLYDDLQRHYEGEEFVSVRVILKMVSSSASRFAPRYSPESNFVVQLYTGGVSDLADRSVGALVLGDSYDFAIALKSAHSYVVCSMNIPNWAKTHTEVREVLVEFLLCYAGLIPHAICIYNANKVFLPREMYSTRSAASSAFEVFGQIETFLRRYSAIS